MNNNKMTFEENIYKSYMYYGEILSYENFEFKEDDIIITMRVAILDGVKRLFICRNGKLVKTEILGDK